MSDRPSERGVILVVALIVLALLSVLGASWLRMVALERETARAEEGEVLARAVAGAGLQQVVAWFAEPSRFVEPAAVGHASPCAQALGGLDVFRKRCLVQNGIPSFRSADARSQFGGTLAVPDLVWSGERNLPPSSELVIGPGRTGSPLKTEIRIAAPVNPDAIALVISRAGPAVGPHVILQAELVEGPWRGFPAAVFATGQGLFPTKVHWGDIHVDGTVDANTLSDRIPHKTPDALVNDHPYSFEPWKDRWVDVKASGSIAGLASVGRPSSVSLMNLHENQALPPPGIWGYHALKRYARRHGTYFATRGTGLLYDTTDSMGRSPTAVFRQASGMGRFLFIDTLDGQEPGSDNLETINLSLDQVQVDSFIGAHVVIRGEKGGPTLVDSPPTEGDFHGSPAQRGVHLANIHYRGVLLVGGTLRTQNRVNLFGAVTARAFAEVENIEIWYDAALRTGYRTGFAPVLINPQSLRRIVDTSPGM